MTIHEQITALLNGDMAESAQVGELLHVLAVSPEKRALMIEQIRMSRAFTAMGGSLAPSHALDSKLWSGIAAIDAGFPPAPSGAAASASAASMLVAHPWINSIAALLLVGVGVGLGYLLWMNSPSVTIATVAPSQTGSPVTAVLASTRDSLAAERSRLQELTSIHARTLAELKSANASTHAVSPDWLRRSLRDSRVREVIRYIDKPIVTSSTTPSAPPVDTRPITQLAPKPAEAIMQRVIMEKENVVIGGLQPVAELPHTSSVKEDHGHDWQVGLRDNFRLSFPRVYGLVTNQSILTDRELYGSWKLKGGETGMFSTSKLGAGIGQTGFSQIYHTNTGGIPIDTIYEQSPTLNYARIFIAPQIMTVGNVSTAIELGGGIATEGTKKIVGPIGTIGLNVEFHPLDWVSVQGGVSAWFLWTRFREQMYTSTNLNFQYGFAFNF